MTQLTEFLDRIEEVVRASELSPFLKYVSPADRKPDAGTVFGDIKFELGTFGEEVTISYRLRPNFEDRSKSRDEENGRTKVRTPFYKESDVVVKWNTLTDRTVSEATNALDLYTKATKLASRIEYMIDNQHLEDVYWENDAPERPSELDRWATYGDDNVSYIMSGSTVKEIRERLRELDLKVSGTKSELKKRLHEYAQEHGDAEKAKRYDEWSRNRVERAA